MADPAILLDPDVKNSGASHKLMIDGQGLALSKGPADEWDSNLVGCRIMGPWPYNLVYVNFLRAKARHPILPIRGMVV